MRSSFAASSSLVGNTVDIGGVTPHCRTGGVAIVKRDDGEIPDPVSHAVRRSGLDNEKSCRPRQAAQQYTQGRAGEKMKGPNGAYFKTVRDTSRENSK